MAAPQLKTYFKKFPSDQFGQIQVTGILNIKTFDKVNLDQQLSESDTEPHPSR